MDRPPVHAYRGSERYVFVCYAHDDAVEVYPEIQRLDNEGVRVFYDEGVTPGHEWTAELGDAIRGASHLLYFITPNSVASRHCRNELHFALRHDVPVLAVHLRETALPSGLDLELGTTQAILRYAIGTARYREKLRLALGSTEGVAVARKVPTRFMRGAAIALGLAALFTSGAWIVRDRTPPAPTFGRSVAVEPFSGDDASTKIAAELPDEIRGMLAGYAELKVVDRGADNGDSARRSADAAYQVVGRLREDDAGVTLRVHLERTADATTTWSDTYGPFAPDRVAAIARRVARNVRHEVVLDDDCESVKQMSDEPEAQALACELSRETARWNQGGDADLALQLANARRLIDVDPDLPHGYWALSDALSEPVWVGLTWRDASRQAHAAVDRAFEIAPHHPFTTFRRGWTSYHVDLDYQTADEHLQEAIRIGGTHPKLHWFHAARGQVALRRGDVGTAVEHYRRALRLNDADGRVLYEASLAFHCAGSHDEAFAAADAGLALYERGIFRAALLAVAVASTRARDGVAAARDQLDRLLSTIDPANRAILSPTLVDLGRVTEAEELAGRLNADLGATLALYHASRRQYDAAIAALHRQIDLHGPGLELIRAEPGFAELRTDPRWQEVMGHLDAEEKAGREWFVARPRIY